MTESSTAPTEASAAKKPKRKLSRGRRIWKWTWRCAVVLLLVTYVTRNHWLGPWLLDRIEPIVAEALGADVELEGIGGGWLGDLSLEGARLLAAGTKTPVRGFEAQGLHATYSLWGLMRGEDDWLQAVELDALSLELDMRQAAPAQEQEEESEPFTPPPALPTLTVGSFQLAYTDGETSAQVADASLTTTDARELLLQLPQLDFTRGEQVAPTLEVSSRLRYQDGVLEIPSLQVDGIERVQTARLDLSAIGQGQLDYDLALSVLDGELSARGSLAERRVRAQVMADGLVAEQLEPYLDLGLRGRLLLNGTVDWPLDDPFAGVADFQFGAARNGWRQVELEAITGRLRVENGWLISEGFEAHGPDLELIAQDCHLPLFAEGAEPAATRGQIDLRVDDVAGWLQRLELELPAEAGALQTLTLRTTLHAQTDRLGIDVEELRLGTSLGRWVARGRTELVAFQLAPESPVEWTLDGSEVDLAALATFLRAHGRALEATPLPLAGTVALRLEAAGTAAAPELTGTFQLQGVDPGPLHPELPPGPYQGQLRLLATDQALMLEPLVISGPQLEADLRARLELPLDLSALAAGELPPIEGAFDARYTVRANPNTTLHGTLVTRGEVQGRLADATTLANAEWQGSLTGSALQAADWQSSMEAFVLTASASWQGADWLPATAQVELITTAPRWQDAQLAGARLDAQYEGAQLRGSLDLSEDPVFPASLQFQVPLDLAAPTELPEGPLKAQLSLARALDLAAVQAWLQQLPMEWPSAIREQAWSGKQLLALEASGSWQDPQLVLQLTGDTIELRPLDEDTAPLLPGALHYKTRLLHRAGTTTLETLSATAGPASVQATGTWSVDAAVLPTLAAGEALPEGTLALDGTLNIPDTRFLESLPGIRRIEGSADATLTVRGTDRAPEVTAEWTYHEGALRLDDPTLAGFERLEFAGIYRKGRLELRECRGELGSAPFTATGWIATDQEVPQVDVQLDGTDLLLYRREGVKVRSDTTLRIHGPLDGLRTEGDLTLTDGRYTKPVDFLLPLLRKGQPPTGGVGGISLFSLGAPLDTMKLDLRVHPGNGFRIKTNVANGMIRPDLRLVGTGQIPYLLGEIYFDPTILTMPAHRITLEQGVIRFSEENPFVPTLDLRASFRRYGYDVTILVEGDVNDPIITMSSVPPLESEDLLLFATTGQPPQEAANAQEALGTVAVYLARDWLRRFFGDLSTEEEESLFDRIEIEFGRDATNQGAETIEGRFLLRRDNLLENDALYLTGERDAYSDFNLGLRIRFLFP